MNPLKHLLDTLDVTLEELRSGSRQRRLAEARSLAAALLMRQPYTRQQDVAELLNADQSGVSRMMARHWNLLEVNPAYRKKWKEITKKQIIKNQNNEK